MFKGEKEEAMKENEKTKYIRTRTLERDGIEYKYDLILKEGKRTDTSEISLYSITVKMTEMGDETTTHSEAQDLFTDEERAIRFFEKLVEYLATPIDLAYVAEDEFLE